MSSQYLIIPFWQTFKFFFPVIVRGVINISTHISLCTCPIILLEYISRIGIAG